MKICKNGCKLCYNELEQYNLALERKPAHHIWKRDFDQLEQAGQTLQIQTQRRMQAAKYAAWNMPQHWQPP